MKQSKINKTVNKGLTSLHGTIQAIARREVIRIVEYILERYKRPVVFHMAMGTYCFSDKNDKNIYDMKVFQELEDFIDKWDNIAFLTGQPLRITEDGIDESY